MGDPTGKYMTDNICCFGASQIGLLVSTVVAHMCPNVTATVVDPNPEKIMSWNTKQFSFNDLKLEEMLKISQNRNLIFTTDTVSAIKAADVIFISLDLSTTEGANKQKRILDFTQIESAIRLIAEVSENSKIIAVKNTVPVGSNEVLKRILDANKTKGEHLIFSFPEFVTPDAVSSYLKPVKFVVGCDLSLKAIQGTEKLQSLFNRTSVPKIIRITNRSAELAKFYDSAFKAQKISNMNALSIICEELGADSSEICKILGSHSESYLEVTESLLGFGKSGLKKHLMYLVELCEDLKLCESAEYWRQVLIMNDYQEKRFFKKILSSFFNNLSHKKLAIWGLESNKNVETVCDSLALDLCKNLVLEGAKLNLYEPKREGRQLMNELKSVGLEENKDVISWDDPYKAAHKTDAIILFSRFEELQDLDFEKIYKSMGSPAHLFDALSCLPFEELIKIGFHVETIGKKIQQPQKFEYIH